MVPTCTSIYLYEKNFFVKLTLSYPVMSEELAVTAGTVATRPLPIAIPTSITCPAPFRSVVGVAMFSMGHTVV